MGGRHDFRGNSLILDFDAPQANENGKAKGSEKVGQNLQSLDYPGVFENLD